MLGMWLHINPSAFCLLYELHWGHNFWQVKYTTITNLHETLSTEKECWWKIQHWLYVCIVNRDFKLQKSVLCYLVSSSMFILNISYPNMNVAEGCYHLRCNMLTEWSCKEAQRCFLPYLWKRSSSSNLPTDGQKWVKQNHTPSPPLGIQNCTKGKKECPWKILTVSCRAIPNILFCFLPFCRLWLSLLVSVAIIHISYLFHWKCCLKSRFSNWIFSPTLLILLKSHFIYWDFSKSQLSN